ELAGIPEDDVVISDNLEEINKAIEEEKCIGLTDSRILCEIEKLDVIVDATGIPDVGASVAINAIENKKHIVMLNVEADITIGVYLKNLAEKNGVVYTGSAGDEPGAIMELYDFSDALGFEIVALGKGKNNP